jgi:hypothetical protein
MQLELMGLVHYRFRLQPLSASAVTARVKQPGRELVGEQRELYLCEHIAHEAADALIAGHVGGHNPQAERPAAAEPCA